MTGPQNYHKLRDCMTSNQYSQSKELIMICQSESFRTFVDYVDTRGLLRAAEKEPSTPYYEGPAASPQADSVLVLHFKSKPFMLQQSF